MKIKILVCIFFFAIKVNAQRKFTCFVNDKNPDLQISVCFDNNDRAKFVKYKGQDETIPLFYSKTVRSPNPGGNPPVYGFVTYIEKYRGKITGKYVFDNASKYRLGVTYIRARDNKEFYFEVLEDDNGVENTMDRL